MDQENWQKSEYFNELVTSFHDKYARMPSGERYNEAVKELEVYKNVISEGMNRQGLFELKNFEFRGSTYEGVKVKDSTNRGNDFEFDLMFIVKGGTDLVFQPDPVHHAYVKLMMRKDKNNDMWRKITDNDSFICPKLVRRQFYGHLTKCGLNGCKIRQHGPAVELDVIRDDKVFFKIDLAPHFELEPNVLFVPKAPKLEPNSSSWLRSYSLLEKKRFTNIDNDNGCRRHVLRMSKVIRDKFSELKALRSYQLKTVLLQLADKEKDWNIKKMGERLIDFFLELKENLHNKRIEHYYNSDINLLEFDSTTMYNMEMRLEKLTSKMSEMEKILK